jgi:hypothetical protein
MPYRPIPWARRLDVQQRAEAQSLLESQRREKEREEYVAKLKKFSEDHVKAGGSEINLADDKDIVWRFFIMHLGSPCAFFQKGTNDPMFLYQDAHDSKIEEVLEQLFDGQIDVIPEDSNFEKPGPTLEELDGLSVNVPRHPDYF